MSNAAMYFLMALTLACGISIIVLLLGRSKLVSKIANLEAKLLASESARTSTNLSAENAKISKAPGLNLKAKAEQNATTSSEVVNLRRDMAELKDEIKKHKDSLKQKDLLLKEAAEEKANALYVLKEENKALIDQLKQVQSSSSVSQESQKEQIRQVNETKKALEEAKAKIVETEKALGREISRQRDYQNKIQALEKELRRFKEAATTADGKLLDPVMFGKWKERALEGRKMYQLMKQLRELSDAKLASYQNAVAFVSENALRNLKAPIPLVPEGKSRADYLLTAAVEAFSHGEDAKT